MVWPNPCESAGNASANATADAAFDSQGPIGSDLGNEEGYSRQLVHYTAVTKKGAPGDGSRHDTPTSVLDIFSALSMVPGSPRVPIGILSSGEPLMLAY